LLVFVGLVVLGCGGSSSSVDMGDSSLGNLMWGVYQYGVTDKDLDKALVYADEAMRLYGDEARQQQASLSGFPSTDPPETTYKYKVLNGVGAIVLAKGDILVEKNDLAGAEESFNMVIQDFGYAQFQDNGEWKGYAAGVPRDAMGFFKLADAAKQRLAEIKAGNN